MGERKGTNHYYPPDYDPKVGGLNKFLGTHALRERARKLHMGILIIRFEMPYNIWCEGCGNHIGMGVRYNAEKKKVGMYYSTPLYQFRMKCHLCDNHFEIKTDPGNLDYVIVSGARRQENRWDPIANEQTVPETKEVSHRLYDDAMFKVEHQTEDVKTSKNRDPALAKLIQMKKPTWEDDYSSNCILRAKLRATKKELLNTQVLDKKLLDKSSLNIKLVTEHEDDIKLARAITSGSSITSSSASSSKRVSTNPIKSLPKKLRLKKKIEIPNHSKTKLSRESIGIEVKRMKQKQDQQLFGNESSSESDRKSTSTRQQNLPLVHYDFSSSDSGSERS
ncbi:coiled-coil domain-containing protein 130 homolog [Neodiprion lecontei]|uniref:Coiled-coil domain-containing protein 130 homolog n=1 Tax=Neodiprion lecontei TaxID=441921 RepID=A0A6J0BH18_NEOLC|nr:coiled-coil domain-containing protein 130 homolog [Neodiprion lecontei]